MYRLTIRICSDDTIRPNTNTLFGALFGTEVNTKRIFGTSLVLMVRNRITVSSGLQLPGRGSGPRQMHFYLDPGTTVLQRSVWLLVTYLLV